MLDQKQVFVNIIKILRHSEKLITMEVDCAVMSLDFFSYQFLIKCKIKKITTFILNMLVL